MSVALRDGFEYEGYAVTVATDGEAGLHLATAAAPDLILLDVMLPKIDRPGRLPEAAHRRQRACRSSCSPPAARRSTRCSA